MGLEDGFLGRLLSSMGHVWARVEALYDRLFARVRSRRRRLKAEARLLSAEVLQLGARLWEKIDDLPFVPSSFTLTPIRTQFYGHGAFMGAAPALVADELKKLAELRDLGVLTDDEFAAQKARLLG